jgi:hypothetical protein
MEDSYRTLKLAMENIRNRVEEAHFYRLELQARRMRRDAGVPRWERWTSYAFEWVSDFGLSLTRPLWWLGGLTLGFALLYLMLGTWWANPLASWPAALEALAFSFSRVFPFGPWGEAKAGTMMGNLLNVCKDGAQTCTGFGPLTALGVGTLATLQSLMAIGLTFLGALALRRRFQIN